MAKKVTAIFVLSVFALLLVVGMAWAKQYAPATPLSYAREDYVTNYLLKPAGEYSFTGTIHSPYDAIVGYTYYEYQHNSSIPRMIANDYQAGGGGKHFTFMELEAAEQTSNRFMDYNYRSPAGAWLGAQRISSPICRGGYTGLDIMKNSREVICFHYVNQCGSDPKTRASVLAIEPSTPGYNEFGTAFDLPDSGILVNGIGPAASYGMWPHMAVDDSNRIHVVFQANLPNPGRAVLGYTRVTELGATSVKCQAPGVPDQTITKGPFTTNTKAASFARTGVLSYVVATSPISPKVALVYSWPTLDTTQYQNGNDIYYIESTSGGNDWLASASFPAGTNITKFKKTDNYKAYADAAAVYDYNGNLHIIWNAHRLNTETGAYNADDVALMHWSKNTERICGSDTLRYSIINAGEWSAVAGGWNRNMGKMNAGVGVSGGSNYNYIYCNWTQFNPNDLSKRSYTNGEIYVSVSTNSGLTWDAPRNVTNSPDPGCLVDDCDSDHWSSMAARVDSFVYLQWINDRDAGSQVQDATDFTLNPVLYYRYPVWTPTAAARMDWTPKNLAAPWISVPNLGSTTKKVSLSNIGTATLNIGPVTTGASWIGIGSYPASIAEGGCPGDLNITINCGLYSETFLADSIRIQSNDGAGNSDIYVKVYVVVSNTYKEPKFKVAGNGNFVLTESNLGNIGNQDFGMNLDTLATGDAVVNPIFDGSIILGQRTATDTVVGRYVFDQQYMLALDTFKVVTKAGVGSQIIKKRYAPMNPMPPEWSNWWCWGVEEYDVIFSSGATTTEKERWLLLQYVKVFQYPPPTWWKLGFGCPGTVPDLYVGEAIDIDLPSDSGSQNFAGFDQSLNLLYQQGYGAANLKYHLGLALRNPNAATQPVAYGGHVLRNDEYVYPLNGYADDSLYNVMSRGEWAVYDTTVLKRTDYDVVLTAGKIASHTPNLDTTRYNFVVAFSNDGLQKLKDLVKMTKCGNANRDAAGAINLGDVIAVAQYVLSGGAQPWLYMADVDGNCAVNLGDCIYLAKYVLGPSLGDPKCNCEQKWP